MTKKKTVKKPKKQRTKEPVDPVRTAAGYAMREAEKQDKRNREKPLDPRSSGLMNQTAQVFARIATALKSDDIAEVKQVLAVTSIQFALLHAATEKTLVAVTTAPGDMGFVDCGFGRYLLEKINELAAEGLAALRA